MSFYTIDFSTVCQLNHEQFYQLCRQNPEIKFERNAQGEILIMSPSGGETGKRNAILISRFVVWNEQMGLGEVFDSSTCFQLPNGANRSPDVAFVIKERWQSLSPLEREQFPSIAPDFVLELMSPSDRLIEAQNKMREYIDNGVQLGWLINRRNRQVEIYRPNQEVEVLDSPVSLSGEDILPNFQLNLSFIWD